MARLVMKAGPCASVMHTLAGPRLWRLHNRVHHAATLGQWCSLPARRKHALCTRLDQAWYKRAACIPQVSPTLHVISSWRSSSSPHTHRLTQGCLRLQQTHSHQAPRTSPSRAHEAPSPQGPPAKRRRMNRPQEQSPLHQGPSVLSVAAGAQAARPGRPAGCSSANPIDHIFQFHKVLHQHQLPACLHELHLAQPLLLQGRAEGAWRSWRVLGRAPSQVEGVPLCVRCLGCLSSQWHRPVALLSDFSSVRLHECLVRACKTDLSQLLRPQWLRGT